MKVPLLDLGKQNAPLRAELLQAFERVMDSGMFILGPEVTRLEESIATSVEAKHGVGVGSGTDALLISLMALGIGPGDEVLVPTFTFFATAGCVARLGARPVFVDINPSDFNLCVEDAAGKITPRTKAIIPVHLYGQSADMAGVLKLARKHDLAVVEDAAQSLGAQFDGKPVGSMGDCGIYSFFPTKNLGGYGEGGMVMCQDDALHQKLVSLRNHGSSQRYYHDFVGGNFRLDALQAALLQVKWNHYAQYVEKRRAHAKRYLDLLSSVAGRGVVLPRVMPGRNHIWNQFTLRLTGAGERERLREFLLSREIQSEVYYPLCLHQQQCFLDLNTGGLPVAETTAQECLSIPIHAELDEDQLVAVVQGIQDFFS